MTQPVHHPFRYPQKRTQRKHGPDGYDTYESYRDWLRDEFEYRCVFCLRRERWYPKPGFHIDHFEPQTSAPLRVTEYANLLYSCPSCNLAKSAKKEIPCPESALIESAVVVQSDGTLKTMTKEATAIVRKLQLDGDDYNLYRRTYIRTMEILAKNEPALLRGWLGYPENLPNLSQSRPPRNSRPDGIAESAWARQQRGVLPDLY